MLIAKEKCRSSEIKLYFGNLVWERLTKWNVILIKQSRPMMKTQLSWPEKKDPFNHGPKNTSANGRTKSPLSCKFIITWGWKTQSLAPPKRLCSGEKSLCPSVPLTVSQKHLLTCEEGTWIISETYRKGLKRSLGQPLTQVKNLHPRISFWEETHSIADKFQPLSFHGVLSKTFCPKSTSPALE